MPLGAQGLERPIEVGVEYKDSFLRWQFYDEIFQFEWDYYTQNGFSDVKMSWPIARDWKHPLRFMFDARPDMWDERNLRLLGHEPDRYGKYYAGLQFLNKKIDARLLHPLIHEVQSEELRPYLELRYLHLFELSNDIDFFGQGWTDFEEFSYSLGISKELGSFTAKAFCDDFNSFSWSIGFKTDIN